jgi:transposase
MCVVPTVPPPIDISALLREGFSDETARELYAQGEEVAVFVMMQLAILAVQVASVNGQHPSEPSGSVAPFLKEPRKSRGKKPGAKPGHKGSRRPPPDKITHHEEHIASCCPDCGGELNRRKSTRKRIIEDIPKDITPEVTEHTIHLDYCPKCKKVVEPAVPDAMPGATIGHRVVVLSAFLHYFIGTTISKIVELFGMQFWFKLTPGGLVQLWHRLASTLKPWYDEIGEMVKASGVLHGDETGWRVNGKTFWLWVFTTKDATYYLIDQSRASRVVLQFFKKAFAGVLVTDFFGAYNSIVCAGKQKCLVHLLGDMKKVEKYKDKTKDWRAFSKRLKRLLRDAMRLCGRRSSLEKATYERRCVLIEKRLADLIAVPWENSQAQRLVKRLRRHRSELLVFLYHEDVPFDNNHAERVIRNAVVMRKNSYSNRSLTGAETQAILMSIFQTLKQRKLPVTSTIVNALRIYVKTKKLPTMKQIIENSAE